MWDMCIIDYYSAIKKNKILPCTTTSMNLEGSMLTEIRQKDKYYVLSLICEIFTKKKKNEYKKTDTNSDTEN